MPIPSRSTVHLAAAMVAAFVAWPVQAESLAVLIGVSGYPSLSPALRLRGPANDVQLMGATLGRLGLPESRVRLLADGVPGSTALPTKANILAALDQAAREVRTGDWAVVYFSGHGSQQPQPEGATRGRAGTEPDRLDEIFLPYDIGRWNGAMGAVDGALVDDEIGAALARIKATGAGVWAIFDTCHAGDMGKAPVRLAHLQASPPPVYRYVSPAELGIESPNVPTQAHQAAKAGPVSLFAATDQVLFYAAHPYEPAAEEVAPDPTAPRILSLLPAQRRYYGVFTYELHRAVASNPKASFADLATTISKAFEPRPFPTPLFEGYLLAYPNFRGAP